MARHHDVANIAKMNDNNGNGSHPHHFIIPAGENTGICTYCGEHKRFISYIELSFTMALAKYKGRKRAQGYLDSLV